MNGGEIVWLVGMMGSGKSTVGPRLARRLGRSYGDTDAAVEREAGIPIPEIFETRGEEAFRALEREAIGAAIADGAPAVVALGGGAAAQPGALARLRETGTVVYLRATLETLAERLGAADGRPLLADAEDLATRLGEILEARRESYEAADVVVDTDGLSPDDVVEALAPRLAGACS